MKKDVFLELFEQPFTLFTQHLGVESNHRIIFSGKYGVGKTSFIQHFFSDEVQGNVYGGEQKFNVIHLYPVNYSVSTNEDIFKYIKYDILYDLLANHSDKIDFSEFQPSWMLRASNFVSKNIPALFTPFVSALPEIEGTNISGETLVAVNTALKNVISSLEQGLCNPKVTANQKILNAFEIEVKNSEGSLYEQNIITQIIIDYLAQMSCNGQKENVLVIDDLDRIDPHHIFRLFNVFAAHFDERSELQNKFNFDKVIFICDIRNIEKIYKHIYGAGVDFKGYIDKFYSKKVFFYDNVSSLKSIINKIVDSIHLKLMDGGNEIVINEQMIKEHITNLVILLIHEGWLNIRSLMKYYGESVFLQQNLIQVDESTFTKDVLSVIIELEVLIYLIGDKQETVDALLNLKSNETLNLLPTESSDARYKGYVVPCLLLIGRELSYDQKYLHEFTYNDIERRLFIRYTKDKRDDILSGQVSISENTTGQIRVRTGYPCIALYKAVVEHLDRINYLH